MLEELRQSCVHPIKVWKTCQGDFTTYKTKFSDFQNFSLHTFTQDILLTMGYALVAIIILHAVLFEGKIICISVYVINAWNFLKDMNEMIVC